MTREEAITAYVAAQAAYADLEAHAPNPRDFARNADSDYLTPFTRVSSAWVRIMGELNRARENAAHLRMCEAARNGEAYCVHLRYLTR